MPESIDTLIAWCDSARKILNKPSPFKGKARNLMETRAKAVQIQLAALKTLIDEEQDRQEAQRLNLKYTEFQTELELLAGNAKEAAERWRNPPKKLKRKKERNAYKKEQRAIVKTASHQLDEMASRIGLFVADELNTDKGTFEQAIQNRQRIDKGKYDTDLPKAEKLARQLQSLNWGDHTWEEPLATKIFEAKEITKSTIDEHERDYINALGLIRQAIALHTLQLRQVELTRESDREKARHLPVYLDKKRRVEEGLAYLRTLPGSETQQVELQKLLDAAQLKADKEEYESAYDALSGLSGTVAKGEKANTKFIAEVGSEGFRTARDEALEALRKYEELAKFQDPEGIQSEQNSIESELSVVYSDPTQAAAAIQKLEVITERLNEKLLPTANSPQWFVNNYKELHPAANVAISEVREVATSSEYESLLDEYRQAEVMFASQFYEVAYALLSGLKADCEIVTRNANQQKEIWDQGIVGNLASIQEAKQNTTNEYLPLQTAAIEVSRLYELCMDHVSRHAYEQANEEFAVLKSSLEGGGDYATAKSNRDTLATKLDEGKLALKNAVDSTQEAIDDLKNEKVDVSPFAQELATEQTEVNSALWSAKTPGELTTWTTTNLPRIAAVQDKVARVKSDDGLLQNAKIDTVKSQIHANLKRCQQECHPDGLSPLKDRVANMDALVTLEELETLNADLQKWLEDLADELTEIRNRTRTLLASLRNKLDKLQKTHKKYRSFIDTLRDKLLDCEGMIESTLLEVVKAGEVQLSEVKLEIENVEGDDFGKVTKKIKELVKKIKDKDLTECMPSKKKVFAYRLKNEIPDSARQHAPESAIALTGPVGKIEKEITDAINDAAARAIKRRDLKTKADDLRRLLAPLEDSPALLDSLRAQLDSAESPGEAGEDAAVLDLTRLEKTIQDATDKPGVRLALEQSTREEQLRVSLAEADWEATKDIFEKNAERDAAAIYKSVTKQERSEDFYKGIAAAKKQAVKLAKAGNYTDAKLKLRQAESLAKQFIQNPLGAKATARGNLQKVNLAWNAAVAQYVIDMRKLDQAIAQAIQQEALTQEDELKKAADNASMCLQRLMLVFDASKFEHAVSVLNSSAEIKVLRRSKEDGLRFLRRYQTNLQKDPVLSRLGVNPFDVDVPISLLRARLGDLETNLLRA